MLPNLLWMSSVVSSLLIPPDSSPSSPLESRSEYFCQTVHKEWIIHDTFRWAQSKTAKGQGGVTAKDVYGNA